MLKSRLARIIVGGGIAMAALGVLAPQPASARVAFGIGIGLPLFAPIYPAPLYPAPVYYPPAYYAPPAPPAYYAPPAAAAPAAAQAPANAQCRQYSTTTVIDGQPQQAYGTACLQPDGSWRITG